MKVVVNGLGEMGASLALAIKNSRPNVEIIGVDRNAQTLKMAESMGLASRTTTDLTEVASIADVIILSTPIQVIIQTLSRLARLPLKSGVLITDTGSTKVQVMQAAQPLIERHVNFVGGHAMAGTQKAGISALNKHLYDGVPYFLVGQNGQAIQKASELLTGIGVKLTHIDAHQHDQMMAYLSDLPHVVSAALVNSTRQILNDIPAMPQFAAGGFRDTTRIGGADPQMWTDILLTNRDATLAALRNYQRNLAGLIEALDRQQSDDVYAFFEASKKLRQKF